MTEQTDAAEVRAGMHDRIWYALATTRCGPLHADDGWTPGEPCESCGDLADEVTPYLSRIVEHIIAAREAAAEARGAQAVLDDLERRIRHQAKAAAVGSMEWRAHFADLAHLETARAAAAAAAGGAR